MDSTANAWMPKPLRRLADLGQWDVLKAANLLRVSAPEMSYALMVWQYRLLRRAMNDGGNAA